MVTLFEDINHLNLMELDQSMDSLPDEWLSIRDDSAVDELGFWDSEMLQSFDECSQFTNSNEVSLAQSVEELSFGGCQHRNNYVISYKLLISISHHASQFFQCITSVLFFSF